MKLSDTIELTFLESSPSKHQRHQPPLEPIIQKKKKNLFNVTIHQKKIMIKVSCYLDQDMNP